jgi:hypothetical protein
MIGSSASGQTPTPVRVSTIPPGFLASALRAGATGTCALGATGAVCWGPLPSPELASLAAKDVSFSFGHACAVMSTNTVRCWGDQLVRAARRRNYRASARRRRAGNRTRRRLRLRCPIGELCGRDRRPCAVLGPRVRTDAERRGNSWRDTGGAWAWPRLCAHRGGGRRVCGGECVRAVGKPRFASEPDANGADRSRADRGGPRSYLCADGRGRREVLG